MPISADRHDSRNIQAIEQEEMQSTIDHGHELSVRHDGLGLVNEI